jgi:ABC transporter substrate binding protein
MNLIIISVLFYFSTISGKAVQRKSRAIGVGLSNDRTSLYAALGKCIAFLHGDETNNWIGKKIVLVIGFLNSASPQPFANYVAGFRAGLKETGYVDGQNVAVEFRWAEGHYDRLPEMAADLVRRKVAVLVSTGGTPSITAAKAATTIIPIVFTTGAQSA